VIQPFLLFGFCLSFDPPSHASHDFIASTINGLKGLDQADCSSSVSLPAHLFAAFQPGIALSREIRPRSGAVQVTDIGVSELPRHNHADFFACFYSQSAPKLVMPPGLSAESCSRPIKVTKLMQSRASRKLLGNTYSPIPRIMPKK
jgi:hypothetical protein